MTLSLLQLNCNSDNYWETLISFLTSRDFDIIQLQEVTGEDTVSGNIDSKRDCFEELEKILGEKYHGELAIAERFTSGPSSYLANATFYKKDFALIDKHLLTMRQSEQP